MIDFPRDLPLVHGPQHTDELQAWAAARIPHARHGFGACWAVGVVRQRRLAAVVVYHLFDPELGTVCLSCAADTPLWPTRRVVGAILRAGFDGLGAPLRKVWTGTAATNMRALRFNVGVGFRSEATVREQFGPRVHGVLCGILRREFEQLYVECSEAAWKEVEQRKAALDRAWQRGGSQQKVRESALVLGT